MKRNLLRFAVAFTFGVIAANASVVVVNNVGTAQQDSAGFYVGPYNGTLDNVAYKIFCDDLAHNIGLNQALTVNVSSIGNLALTRFGGVSNAMALYQQVFFLSSYLLTATTERANIQDAIWGRFKADSPNQATTGVQFWINLAQDNYQGKDYSSFRVLTDSGNQFNGKQELFISTVTPPPGLTKTPEPGTWALLLSGAGILAVVNRRRR